EQRRHRDLREALGVVHLRKQRLLLGFAHVERGLEILIERPALHLHRRVTMELLLHELLRDALPAALPHRALEARDVTPAPRTRRADQNEAAQIVAVLERVELRDDAAYRAPDQHEIAELERGEERDVIGKEVADAVLARRLRGLAVPTQIDRDDAIALAEALQLRAIELGARRRGVKADDGLALAGFDVMQAGTAYLDVRHVWNSLRIGRLYDIECARIRPYISGADRYQ